VPFPWNEDERKEHEDPRRSIMARFSGQADYMRAADKEIGRQIAAGFLLADERQWARESLLANWVRVDSLSFLWPKVEGTSK